MKTINPYLKNLFFGTSILAVLALPFSCTQDTSLENLDGAPELNAVEAKTTATRPIKAQLNFIFYYSNPTNIVPCTPDVALFKTIVSGNMSHLGSLQPGFEFDEGANEPISGSWFIPVSCNPTSQTTIDVVYRSVYVAANGDELHAVEEVTLTFTSRRGGTFQGTGTINGADSTGRFKDASGNWNSVNGVFDATPDGDGASWEIKGEITY